MGNGGERKKNSIKNEKYDYNDDDDYDDDYDDDDDDDDDDDREDGTEPGTVKCLTCGTKNTIFQKKCIHCNNVLLRLSGTGKSTWKADDKVYEDESYYEGIYERELPQKSLICLTCGINNSIDEKYCVKCGSLLIKPFEFIEETSKNSGLNFKESIVTISSLGNISYVITPHLGTLMANVMGFMDGTVSMEEYRKAVTNQRTRVNRSLKKLPGIVEGLMSLKTKESDEIATLFTSGLHLYSDALDRLENYFRSKNKDDITKGIEMAKEANQQVYRVKVMTARPEK